MPHLWLKKNPFMSLWLSAANRVAGSVQGQVKALVKAQATRQVRAALAEQSGQPARRVSTAAASPAAKKTGRKR